MGYDSILENFIQSHELSCDHVRVKNGGKPPDENVSKDVRLKVPRRVVVDVLSSKRRYACVACEVAIERNAYKVKLHLESIAHKSKNIVILPNELMSIEEYTLTNVENVVNRKKDLFFLEPKRSEKYAEVICKLCDGRLKIEWHRSENIFSHERTDKHKELLKLQQVYQHVSLTFHQIRSLHKRNKVLELLSEAEQDIKHFEFMGIKEPNEAFPVDLYLLCNRCKEKVASNPVSVSNHIHSQYHKDNLPKSDGYSDYEYNVDLIKTLVAGKYMLFFCQRYADMYWK